MRLMRDAAGGGRRELGDLLQAMAAAYLLLAAVHPAGSVGLMIHRAVEEVLGLTAVPAAGLWGWLAVADLIGRPGPGLRGRLALLSTLVWLAVVLALIAPGAGGSLGALLAAAARGALGLTGSLPVLVAWLAVTGHLGLAPEDRGAVRALLAGVGRAAWRAGQDLLDFVAPATPAEPEGTGAEPSGRRRNGPLGLPAAAGGEREAAAAVQPGESPLAAAPAVAAPSGIGDSRTEPEAEPSGRAGPPPGGSPAPAAPARPPGGYALPPLSLLEKSSSRLAAAGEASQRRRLLEETLRSFGVTARVVDAVQGPAVTRFELQPAPGIKVSRILSLQDDIALALAAPRVRIEAPIPGRNVVGIEVPNLEVAAVRLRDVLESPAFQREASPLAVALGKDVAGAPVVAALDRMPHLLIAGATGSGKSVCINAIIASLLFRATPDRVRLLLIDPKVVELGQYDGLPHLLAPVVTDPREAYGALTWVIREMEGRYHRFAERGARDITRYNALLDEGEEPLPYVVVVIDELADLMMVASTKVEDAIARLAQMARAAGIHLVVATQRPSVDVITGLIKANIPSRLAFAVSSQVDSRTILDSGGAEKLLGRGDMLFSPMGAAKPIRAQGALVTEGEVEALIAYVRAQAQPRYEDEVIRSAQAAAVDEEPPEEDPLFADALRVVIEAKGASASLLQRRLRVGYSRAARLVDAMADRGYVGPPDGARPRQVRLTMAEYGRLFADRQLGEPAEPPPDPPV